MAGIGTRSAGRRCRQAVVVLLMMAACAGLAGAGDGLSGPDREQARRLYAQLKAASEQQRARQCLELAGTLLDYYPAFDRNDEVLTLAVDAAARLGDKRHALALTDELLADYPDSPLVDGALERAAQIAVAAGDSLRAAHFLVLHYDRDPVRGQRDDGAPRSAPLLERLATGQLADLVIFHPDSALLPWLQCRRVQSLLDAGRDADARSVAADLELAAPGDRWTVAALNLLGLSSPLQASVRREPDGPVHPRQVGLLCPLTGRYAELGAAFHDAARLALQATNQELGREFTLVVEDTGGDPVNGALAARRLCRERGSIALFGDLLSDPTTAAAVVAEQYGAPLVSPTATNDRIWEIGPNVFQTNLTGQFEPRLLANLASTVLLKSTYAVLYPDEPEGRRHADAFVAEVERLGGRVVAQVAFAPEAIDFQEAVLEVRGRRPEVLFVPATVEQMILLGPQLEFHRVGALVMGLSTWNSALLAESAGKALEGAVFPDNFPLYPAHWAESFAAAWPAGNYPPEAAELALQAYQSLRMLLDTLAGSGARTRAELADALRRRISRDELDVAGPESYAATVRVMREQHAVPFPAALYSTGWEPAAPAPAAPAAPRDDRR
jgi:branched-chain amino acid transport system substrate-binding protein